MSERSCSLRAIDAQEYFERAPQPLPGAPRPGRRAALDFTRGPHGARTAERAVSMTNSAALTIGNVLPAEPASLQGASGVIVLLAFARWPGGSRPLRDCAQSAALIIWCDALPHADQPH